MVMMLQETVMIRLVITILVEISQIILENTNMENMQGSIFLQGFFVAEKIHPIGKKRKPEEKRFKKQILLDFLGVKTLYSGRLRTPQ